MAINLCELSCIASPSQLVTLGPTLVVIKMRDIFFCFKKSLDFIRVNFLLIFF